MEQQAEYVRVFSFTLSRFERELSNQFRIRELEEWEEIVGGHYVLEEAPFLRYSFRDRKGIPIPQTRHSAEEIETFSAAAIDVLLWDGFTPRFWKFVARVDERGHFYIRVNELKTALRAIRERF